jgi:cysteine/histidine-rich domain-containing protein 1
VRANGNTVIHGKSFQSPISFRFSAPCTYHPGAPFFHDAYKGWTCCNKKATDFTEFLNFPGCLTGPHSNVKPVEPEKITGNLSKDVELPEAPPQSTRAALETRRVTKRPSFESEPLMKLNVKVASALQTLAQSLVEGSKNGADENGTEVAVGEPCKNGGCKQVLLSVYLDTDQK